MADEPDELDALLAPPRTGETPGLREALLQRTQHRLAVNRWARRVGKFAAAVAIFVAGAGVGAWRSRPERELVVVPTPVPQVKVVLVPVLVPVPGASAGSPPAPDEPRRARVIELDAEQADDARSAALYRQAGDAYLAAEQDYANAARCYRLFLARSGGTTLSPEPGDSWLLTSLKNAAFKEKTRATIADG
ncbi:MAG: hypothetical protein J0I06_07040 [Planctomycetes bacterium]|nr:hypothetical protein [Planctomycetota bacterium]